MASVPASEFAPGRPPVQHRECRHAGKPPTPVFIGSLARGLRVLRSFSAERPEMTLTQVADCTNLTRAGARRFLLTLVELGYVRKDVRLFRLTPKVLELGLAYLCSTPLSRLSQPCLKQFTELTGESCSIAVLDGDEVVFIARTLSRRFLRPGMHVGMRMPACYTAAGRMLVAGGGEAAIDRYLETADLQPRTRHAIDSKVVLRAELLRVMQQGFAIVDQELEEGLCSLSVALRDHSRQVIAAINTASHVAAVPRNEMLRRFLPLLRAVAADIEDALAT